MNANNCKHIPERDLLCILLATLLFAGDCLGATICADLAVCPAAFGDIGNRSRREEWCSELLRYILNMGPDGISRTIRGAKQDRYAIDVSSIKEIGA